MGVQIGAHGKLALGEPGFSRELFGRACKLLPGGVRHDEREVGERADVADLRIPLAVFEHHRAPHLAEMLGAQAATTAVDKSGHRRAPNDARCTTAKTTTSGSAGKTTGKSLKSSRI